MNIDIIKKVDSMNETYLDITKQYMWENDLSRHFMALIYTLKGKKFDKYEIEDMRKFIKENTGIFSNFRGNNLFTLSMLLCSQYDNPKEKFMEILKYYEKLRKAGFKGGNYLPLASYSLTSTYNKDNVEKIINRAYDIYSDIKKKHPWITGEQDYPLCILLASLNKDIDIITKEVERCYNELNKEGFSKGNNLQFLSHILSLSEEESTLKAKRCKNIYDKLKDNKLKIGSEYYAVLGIISLLGDDIDRALNDVISTSNYINGLKKYKWLGKGMNILLASSIISWEYINTNKHEFIETTFGISVEVLIAAQTAAVLACVTACTAVSSSSN
ncbi:DUF4003 family protein [Alkalithermobacter paradoxus]|uniref:DUF4003 domain-containing protein n=1 Tax=Alkalithermobacter paradoxus TaxID=29349 RepID=A0A1V4IC17_9FIRM|nr:hypothetical protein CLOTH_03490 [[Clostridium] thermoalcaliphilum]